MIEKQIEAKSCEYDKSVGVMPYKFTSPNRAAVPDRLKLAFIPPEHREIVARYVRFVEYKKEGGKPTAPQVREIERLRSMGFAVHVIDNVDDSKKITRMMNIKELSV